MTVEINGYEINLANVLYVTPVTELKSGDLGWDRFNIIFKGRENELFFTSGYPASNPHNLANGNELLLARQKIIDALNIIK